MNIWGDVLLTIGGPSVFFICASDFKSKVLQVILLIVVAVIVLIGTSLIDEDDEDDIDDFIDRTK